MPLFAGERREYVLTSELGVIKADVPISETPFEIGQQVAFDLPKDAAVQLERLD